MVNFSYNLNNLIKLSNVIHWYAHIRILYILGIWYILYILMMVIYYRRYNNFILWCQINAIFLVHFIIISHLISIWYYIYTANRHYIKYLICKFIYICTYTMYNNKYTTHIHNLSQKFPNSYWKSHKP